MSEELCKDKMGVFVGLSFSISTDRTLARLFITINDGNFCIDTQQLTFKIVNMANKEYLQNIIEVEERESVEGVSKYSIHADGIITVPEPLVCAHEFGHETDTAPCNVQKLIDYLRRVGNYNQEGKFFYKICKKCNRVEHTNKSTSTLVADNLTQNFEYELVHYEDMSYKMLCLILKHISRTTKNFLIEYVRRNNMKAIACGFSASIYKYPGLSDTMQYEFWVDMDTFPCFFLTTREDIESISDSFARKSARLIGFNNLLRLEIGKNNIVEVDSSVISFCSLQDYRNFLKNPISAVIDDLQEMARHFIGKKISFISSTPQGGGVALIRHAHIRFYKLLGIDVSWYVTIPSASVYNITKKKFHNVLQNVPKAEELRPEDIKAYETWVKVNCERLWNNSVFRESDIIVLDDHQTSGFLHFVRKSNPNARIIYRSHIQIRGELYSEKSRLTKTWDYISSNIADVDMFVSHPIETFVPSNIDRKKIVFFPPSTDPLDGLNKPLSPYIMDYYETLFYKSCAENQQKIFPLCKPYIVQISRFDPSKGQKDAIDMFRIIFEHLKHCIREPGHPLHDLHLILCGHGSVDDPEGGAIFNELTEYLNEEKNKDIKDNVLLIKLPPLDQMLNLILRKARVAVQLSISEGFEIKVTEAVIKNVPVVVYDSGGLPLQVFDGHTGFVVPCGDIDAAAEKVIYLLENPAFVQNMRGYVHLSYIYTTPFQIMGWMHIFMKVLKKESGNGHVINEDMIKKYFEMYQHFMLSKMKK